jgi:hypothetical protein
VEPQVFHSEQTEQQDEGIEGLETMMAEMQQALKVLTTKIKSSEFHVYYLTSTLVSLYGFLFICTLHDKNMTCYMFENVSVISKLKVFYFFFHPLT